LLYININFVWKKQKRYGSFFVKKFGGSGTMNELLELTEEKRKD
jgi:hypothetical protein